LHELVGSKGCGAWDLAAISRIMYPVAFAFLTRAGASAPCKRSMMRESEMGETDSWRFTYGISYGMRTANADRSQERKLDEAVTFKLV
jgi:hypothetical protein